MNLACNEITDISPLSGNINLLKLDISKNAITNIDALSKLTNLIYFNISFNQISDISIIANMASLNTLNIVSTEATNLAPLYNLKQLKKLLITLKTYQDQPSQLSLMNLQFNYPEKLSKISQILQFEPKMFIDLNNEAEFDRQLLLQQKMFLLSQGRQKIISVIKVPDLSSFSALTSLSIVNANLVNIDNIASLINLKLLNVQENRIRSLKPLKDLNLQILECSCNQIKNLSFLSYHTNLTHLSIIGNQISDIYPLVKLKLQEAYFTNNQITSVYSPISFQFNKINLDNNFLGQIEFQNVQTCEMRNQQVPSKFQVLKGQKICAIYRINEMQNTSKNQSKAFLNRKLYSQSLFQTGFLELQVQMNTIVQALLTLIQGSINMGVYQ
ncbi:Conserved_hypothetical protein [Hexamita inflata]|uniref:Uncharacterized protein n=1 Tax=Hexamita inflata TaxID=28002 RepID=A0AA86UNW3_9EUKA|nr:Conserved hypothetical protein [Hexamita inflata]